MMSGECDDCGEHCLECSCKQSRSFSVTKDKFCIIGGDIHRQITRKELVKLQKSKFVGWWVEEASDYDYVWIPVKNEKANPRKGKWIWREWDPHKCDLCDKPIFQRKGIEG